MITALSTPAAGNIILDANNTVIRIQSTNGEGFYFRAKIYIDGELFDEQSWSRSDAFTATKDLKKLYNAYFEPMFPIGFATQLTEQTHLKKLVAITIEEYNLDSGTIAASLTLPAFYILYNIKPEYFNDTAALQVLGMDAPVTVVPKDGKITIPFYVNQPSGNVSVRLVSNFGTIIPGSTRTVANVSGKKVFLYHFDLAGVALSYSTLWLTAEITNGLFTPIKPRVFRINRLPDYPIKEIAYLNNYGFYQYAYFDGEMETENGFSAETYETADGTEVIYEINEKANYTLNTGTFRTDELAIVNMVANSPDTRLLHDGTWKKIVSKIKKQLEFKDKVHNYAEKLQFTLQKGTDISNIGMITVEGLRPDIEITEFDVIGSQLLIHFVLNNGYTPTALTVQYRVSASHPWLTNTGGVVSPRTINVPPGTYQVRLIDTSLVSPSSTIENVLV